VRRSIPVAVLSALLWVAAAPAAMAAGGDPSKVGDNVKSIVTPNVKAFWWVALVCGLVFMAISRKASRAGGVAVILIISGIAIWNPGGVTNMMSNFAQKVV
jgi:hypothetical protein